MLTKIYNCSLPTNLSLVCLDAASISWEFRAGCDSFDKFQPLIIGTEKVQHGQASLHYQPLGEWGNALFYPQLVFHSLFSLSPLHLPQFPCSGLLGRCVLRRPYYWLILMLHIEVCQIQVLICSLAHFIPQSVIGPKPGPFHDVPAMAPFISIGRGCAVCKELWPMACQDLFVFEGVIDGIFSNWKTKMKEIPVIKALDWNEKSMGFSSFLWGFTQVT